MNRPTSSILDAMDTTPTKGAPGAGPLPEDEVDVYELRARTVATLQELLEQAQAEIELMRGSTSWRVTAPLRATSPILPRHFC